MQISSSKIKSLITNNQGRQGKIALNAGGCEFLNIKVLFVDDFTLKTVQRLSDGIKITEYNSLNDTVNEMRLSEESFKLLKELL